MRIFRARNVGRIGQGGGVSSRSVSVVHTPEVVVRRGGGGCHTERIRHDRLLM